MIIIADAVSGLTGAFGCTSRSAFSVSSGASLDITSTSIDLDCNVTGPGEISLSCDNDCEMSLGGDSNSYSSALYHLSNSELSRVQTTGTTAFGSQYTKNISRMIFDGADASFSGSRIIFTVPHGRIDFLNTSSLIEATSTASNVTFGSSQNITLDTTLNVVLSSTFQSLEFIVDTDCTAIDVDHFTVSSTSSASLIVLARESSRIVISAPALSIEGNVNVTSASHFELQGLFDFSF